MLSLRHSFVLHPLIFLGSSACKPDARVDGFADGTSTVETAMIRETLARDTSIEIEMLALPTPKPNGIVMEDRFPDHNAGHDETRYANVPFILQSDLDKPERLYTCLKPDEKRIINGTDTVTRTGNFAFVVDLLRFAHEADVPRATLWFTATAQSERWAQDICLLGYGIAPGRSCRYTVQALRALKDPRFVRYIREMEGYHFKLASADPTLDLYAALENLPNSQDFGGNFIASPPTQVNTAPLPAGRAGPAVEAHAPAPFGKILYCASRLGDVKPSTSTLAFFAAQGKQPLLPVDVSAFEVGHVDEAVSFIPAPRVQGKKWKLLVSSPTTANKIFQRFMDPNVGGANATRWHRKRERGDKIAFGGPAELERDFQFMSESPFMDKLELVRNRLRNALALEQDDIVRVPVPVDHGSHGVEAHLPNMVNLQVLNNTLIVPKPWAPRVSIETAKKVLEGIDGLTPSIFDDLDFSELLDEVCWFSPMQTSDLEEFQKDLAVRQANGEIEISRAQDTKTFSTSSLPSADALSIRSILADRYASFTGVPTGNWTRVELRWKDSVCLFEAYMLAKLKPLGVTLRFVDDWPYYHIDNGDVHCGTKVARTVRQTGYEEAEAMSN